MRSPEQQPTPGVQQPQEQAPLHPLYERVKDNPIQTQFLREGEALLSDIRTLPVMERAARMDTFLAQNPDRTAFLEQEQEIFDGKFPLALIREKVERDSQLQQARDKSRSQTRSFPTEAARQKAHRHVRRRF